VTDDPEEHGVSGSFRLVALDAGRFARLFGCSDAELAAAGMRRSTVASKPGYPCRVSLADAEVGETVILTPFTHHEVDSPYRASGPIYVRQGAPTARPGVGEVPVMFRHRLLSLRAYDSMAMMVGVDVVQGSELEASIGRLFADPQVGYLHIHNAGPGCYNCSVVRA
jgi:hypothetical protein